MRRSAVRELVMKALFSVEMEKGDSLRQLDYIARDGEMAGFEKDGKEVLFSESNRKYAGQLIAGVLSHQTELDRRISEHCVDWDISRLGGVERNILRISLFEMLFAEKLHPAIAINEAVILIKKFGSPEGAKFVNAVLDAAAEELKSGAALS